MAVTQQQVAELYVATFNRAPDADGLDYWVNLSGLTITQIAKSFFDQAETQALYPTGTTNTAFVTSIYTNLFNRTPDAAGLAYWEGELTNGHMTRSVMIEAMKNGALGADAAIIANKTTVALYYTDLGLQDTDFSLASVTAYQSSVTAAKISVDSLAGTASLSLTAGVDTITGTAGNDVINATNTTLTAFDTINGGLGNDALNYTGTAPMNVSPAGLSVSSVETANFRSVGDLTIDTSAWTGLTTANVTQVVDMGDLDLTAATTTNVNVSAVAGYVTVAGGKNVTVNQSSVDGVTVNGATGAVSITTHGTAYVTAAMAAVTVAAQGNIWIDGAATAVNASILDAVSLAERTALEDAAYAEDVIANAANDAANDASNYASALSSLSGVLAANTTLALNNSDTLGYYQDGVITQAQKVQIDTAFATAYAATVGIASVKEAAAQAAAVAIVTPLLTAANANVVTTDDAYVVADAARDTAWSAYYDIVDFYADMYVETSAASSVTLAGNVDGGEDYVNDSSLLSNVLTTVTLDNSGADYVYLNGKALTNVNVTDSSIYSIDVNNATVGHTQNLTVTNSDISDFYDDVATTVNVIATDSYVGYLSAGSATALNITSNGTENSVWLNADSATAVKISGAGNLQTWFDGDVAANAVITATTATGDIETGVGAAQSYLGGSGVDTVTVYSAKQTAVVSGGAGSHDMLILDGSVGAIATTGAAKFTNFEALKVVNYNFNSTLAVDVSTLTGSTITSVAADFRNYLADIALNGLNAAQAANVTIMNGYYSDLTLGVTGATATGQLDVVNLHSVDYNQMSTLNMAGVETLNITASNDDLFIDDMTGSAALTAINVTGDQYVEISMGAYAVNVNTVVDAHASTGDFNFYAYDANGNANGLKIIGSDTADNTIYGNNNVSIISAGNGNNYIEGGTAADTITVGNGDNYIDAGNGANVIVAGNGYNTIYSGTGNDTITVGTGYNFIDAGTGADTITLGAHGIAVPNTIFIDNGDSGITASTSDKITGFVSGTDTLVMGVAGDATALTGNYVEATAAVADFAAALAAANIALATLDTTSAATTLYSLQYVGTTAYLFQDTGTLGGTADQVITLTGVTSATFAATDISTMMP